MNARQIAVIGAVAIAVVTPAVQASLDLGLSQREFAASGDGVLRAAGWAFSIWSLIYAGLIAYAIWQAPEKRRDVAFLASIGWPAAVAVLGCGLWIVAAAADARWASVAIILVSAGSITGGLWRAPLPTREQKGERLLAVWPLGLLAGWLTIASALNLLTVAKAEGLISQDAAAPAALAGLVLVAACAIAVVARTRITAYGVAIAWGLFGVWAAEQTQKSAVAGTALLFAVAVAAWSVWTLARRRGL